MPRSPLSRKLKQKISAEGSISVEDYMGLCLTDAEHGYYRTGQPLGTDGDFITAPEISQMFGELIGLWSAALWQAMGEPRQFKLIELGPGRGALMSDALRAIRAVPGFLNALEMHLIEISEVLRAGQRRMLAPYGLPAWHEELSAVPAGPAVIIANEFFDALPIRQYIRANGGWRERRIGLAGKGRLAFTLGEPARLAPGDDPLPEEAEEGGIAEQRPAAAKVIQEFARRARAAPLAALTIDYGYERGYGDTFQAVRRHHYADPFCSPGESDLTAHVDFAALARAAKAEGLAVWGPMFQGEFLLRLGLEIRCERLLQHATAQQRAAIMAGVHRLVDPAAMGTLFKVMVMTDAGLGAPFPFAAAPGAARRSGA